MRLSDCDPRKAETLGEACDNGDGTFNGFKLLSWLSECVSPGKGISESEVKKIYTKIKVQNRR